MKFNAVIIDDDEDDRYLAKRILTESGRVGSTLEFENGEQALSWLSSKERFEKDCGPHPPPTLILLDINMPRVSGFEVLESIEQSNTVDHLSGEHSCIIMMFTSSNSPIDRARADECSMVKGYIVKPFEQAELGALLAEHYAGL